MSNVKEHKCVRNYQRDPQKMQRLGQQLLTCHLMQKQSEVGKGTDKKSSHIHYAANFGQICPRKFQMHQICFTMNTIICKL